MGNIKSFFGYFSRFRKVKKVKQSAIPRYLKQKTANVLVYGFVSLLCLVGFLGSVRAISLSSQVSSLKKQVQNFEAVVSDLPENHQSIDVSKVRQYMSDFVKVYINYDADASEQRASKLDQYYSFPVAAQKDVVKQPRKMTGQSLIGLREESDFYVADVKVSFETIENGQTVSKLRVLGIPFKMENGLFAIISPPYFKREDTLTGQAGSLERKARDTVDLADESTIDSIQEFLPVFFDKYASSDEVDLALVMKDPRYMGGHYAVDSIQDNSVLIYKEGKNTVVQLSVDFVDKGNEAVHTENFTLYLVNQDSGWFVEKMFNYFK